MNSQFSLLICFLAFLVTLFACQVPVTTSTSQETGSKRAPISVSYQQNATKTLASVEADVSQVTTNLRRPSLAPQARTFRLHQKIVDGEFYQRQDFETTESGLTQHKAIVSNGKSLVIFDPENETHAVRLAQRQGGQAFSPITQLSQKVTDLEKTLGRLSQKTYSLRRNATKGTVEASWHGKETIGSTGSLQKRTIEYDTKQSVLKSDEVVSVDAEGIVTTVKTEFEYVDTPVGPVIQQKTTTTTKHYPYTLDVSDRKIPRIDSLSGIPVLTKAEVENKVQHGALIYQTGLFLGDPSSPDETTQTVETYNNLRLNQTDDSMFRLVRE